MNDKNFSKPDLSKRVFTKRDLINVYNDTIKKCNHPFKPSVKYSNQDLASVEMIPKFEKMVIDIVNQDTFECLIANKNENINNIVGLNMASNTSVGGGVKNGAMAQEEELFRRSNYFQTLNNFHPLNGSVVYSPQISIFKDVNYNEITPTPVAMIAAAALKNPILDDNGAYNEKDCLYMNTCINNIFKTAYKHNHDIIVLGAIGCGAYHNNPLQVIKIFNKYLTKYWGCFSKIIFAVYSIKDDNFELFSKYINNQSELELELESESEPEPEQVENEKNNSKNDNEFSESNLYYKDTRGNKRNKCTFCSLDINGYGKSAFPVKHGKYCSRIACVEYYNRNIV